MTDNRRQFSRILFRSEAQLFSPTLQISVSVIDLSLKGALVQPIDPVYIEVGTPCTLKIHLNEHETLIRMESTVVHHEGRRFGLACREIDLESLTHLRRLVELNLGDESLLHRELTALAAQD